MLRLRKRTRRGRDYTLKRAMVLLQALRGNYDQLKRAVSASVSSAEHGSSHRETLTRSSAVDSDELKQADLSLDDVQLALQSAQSASSVFHFRTFMNAGEGRFLCRVGAVFDEHMLADCNTLWSEQMRRPRERMVGCALKDVFLPSTFTRYQAACRMLLEHGSIVIRNLPIYQTAQVCDVAAWVEYEDVQSIVKPESTADMESASEPSDVPRLRRPAFFQAVQMNHRPLAELVGNAQPALFIEPNAIEVNRSNSMKQWRPYEAAPADPDAGHTPYSTVDSYRGADESSSCMDVDSTCASPAPLAWNQNQAPDQCGVIMPMQSVHRSDEPLAVFPWASDFSDKLLQRPLVSITRSEVPFTIPQRVLQHSPDLLTPCAGAPRFALYTAHASGASYT